MNLMALSKVAFQLGTMACVLAIASLAAAEGLPGAAPAVSSPKVAILVVGDPDAPVRSAARTLEIALKDAGLRTPSDPALSAALRGEAAPKTDDGLGALRALRRGLGLVQRDDVSRHVRAGKISGADALVVLAGGQTITAEVFDVGAGQFYDKTLSWSKSTVEERVAFVKRRAVAARNRAVAASVEPIQQVGKENQTSAQLNTQPAQHNVQLNTNGAQDDRRARKWFKKNWPYFLVGALVAGGATYLIIDRRGGNDSGSPVLRFGPGGS